MTLNVDDQYALFPTDQRQSDVYINQEYAFLIVDSFADSYTILFAGKNINDLP